MVPKFFSFAFELAHVMHYILQEITNMKETWLMANCNMHGHWQSK